MSELEEARGGRDHLPDLCLVPSGMPSGGMWASGACEGRRGDGGGGRSGTPYHQGLAVPACLALTEYIYHPDRIVHPMKRAKEDRGLDKWERCSWDEATDLVAERRQRDHREVRRRDHRGLRRHRPRGELLVHPVGQPGLRLP